MQLVKRDIDDAISSSYSYKNFKTKLENQGYSISYNEETGLLVSRNNSYKVPITKEMKIAIKHLDSLSQQTILLTKDKITHEIDDLKVLIKKVNKDIVNCFKIENRTILLQNQLEIERTKEIIKDKKKDKLKAR